MQYPHRGMTDRRQPRRSAIYAYSAGYTVTLRSACRSAVRRADWLEQLRLQSVAAKGMRAVLDRRIGSCPIGVTQTAGQGATGANPEALRRRLRLLAARGVFAASEDRFAHTGASRCFAPTIPLLA
jgi:hypothetical protein